MRRIDLHTHVFNVRYLPVAGILHQRGGLPKLVARAIAKLLNWRTGEAIGHPAAGAQDRTLMAAEPSDASLTPAAALAAATPVEFIDDPEVREALAIIAAGSAKSRFAITTAAVDSEDARGHFERLYAQVETAQRDGIFATGREYLNWFKFLTHSEQFIVDRLLVTYGNDVQLFVHHMMDMQHYYDPGDCYYDFVGVQLDRMRRLVDANKGRLLTFVAWSPKRPNNVSVVRRAIDGGIAAGVKVYPPSGYQPDEAMNDPLFEFAVSRGVPLFAHCTPEGFEARPGYGRRADPVFWRNVLHRGDKDWRALRLCLAHAGGDAPWFGQARWAGSFAERAVQLAVDPLTPNVYLEFGYHDDVLNPARRKQFATILAKQIDASDGRLGDRIVYGTDWHMIQRLPDHAKYFEAFADVFRKPPLDAFADRFFFQNAAAYLNLPAFATRRDETDPVRKHVEKVMKAARIEQRQSP
jgi:predicted TIM-barrel fold metal-dependent hydrolase